MLQDNSVLLWRNGSEEEIVVEEKGFRIGGALKGQEWGHDGFFSASKWLRKKQNLISFQNSHLQVEWQKHS